MEIEIWSDIMCPFCYIGKRKLEHAMAEYEARDDIHISWKSYQLSPDLVTDSNGNLNAYLAKHKNISIEQAALMNAQVSEMAAREGLIYNLNSAIPANTARAHQFSHLAKKHGKQHEAEELLFAAYFTEGKNIDDIEVLKDMGIQLGIAAEETERVLQAETYAGDVMRDIVEAQQIGVRGVPFFVFDRKYAISGAQPVEAFLQTLEAVRAEST
jgi:predicted DsbA family dithiol-disulfide isomerase